MIQYIILAFLIGLLTGEYFNNRSNARYLVLKSEKLGRTAACVLGEFYYIVPEKEYIELDLLRLSQNQNRKEDVYMIKTEDKKLWYCPECEKEFGLDDTVIIRGGILRCPHCEAELKSVYNAQLLKGE